MTTAGRLFFRVSRSAPHWLTSAWAMRVIELFLMGDCAVWALQLAIPPDTFAASRAYDSMAQVATEGHWAAMFAFVAIVAFAVLILEAHPRFRALRNLLRVISACLQGCILLAVAGLVFDAAPAGVGWETYGGIAGLSYWLMGVRFLESL